MKLKACHISDTHDVYQDLTMLVEPNTGIVFITGDFTYRGRDEELVQFIKLMKKLRTKVRHIVVIPGNHEVGCEKKEKLWKYLFKRIGVHFLVHESLELEGIKIFGSPWTPEFFDWAYNIPKGEEAKRWASIPEDTQILLTHGPRYLVLDKCPKGHVGDCFLGNKIDTLLDLKYHLFGHIHMSNGTTVKGGILYSNASIMSEKYRFINKANHFVINL